MGLTGLVDGHIHRHVLVLVVGYSTRREINHDAVPFRSLQLELIEFNIRLCSS